MITLNLSEEDVCRITHALAAEALRRRSSAPDPWYVGSPQSRAYAAAMGEAVKLDRLAESIEAETQAVSS